MLSSRPQSPKEEDCCGNSCNPCIFDVHKSLLKQWELKKLTGKSNNLLAPLVYKIFEVCELKQINSDYITIILRYSDEKVASGRVIFYPGQHAVINYSKWSKPFTPISWTDDTMELLVRIYANGVNTKKLKNLKIGEAVKVRGPYGDFRYSRNKFKSLVMFSIGSGLAAFLPIIRSIVDDEEDETRVYLNAGFRSLSLVPLTKKLQFFTDFWNVECTLYLTEGGNEKINGVDIERGRINEKVCKNTLDNFSASSSLILICGTEEFNISLEKWIVENNFINYHVFR